ncbi:MAG: tripartite tricarboxylate transporter substrate binding protein, partial [Burkholderiaceae bacterium]|nr:tripartite tricarboxylate transporter substrate binding protein [Burkholderiaceae bacterium]
MYRRQCNFALLALGAGLLSPGMSAAQAFPSQPVNIMIPLGTGSATDALMRMIAPKLSELWGQSVVLENKPGANGITGTSVVVRAAPNGYNLFAYAANHVVNASLYPKLPYDAFKDFKPIVRIAFVPLLLCVNASVPANSVKELVDLAKSKPGKLNFGSAGSGSPTHLAGETLKSKTGIEITHVPYKAVNQAQTDLLAGTLDMMFIVPAVAIPHIKTGRLRALGITAQRRLPQLAQVPTMDEAGVPGVTQSWIGIAGQAAIPDAIANKIAADVMKVVSAPDVQEAILNLGMIVDPLAPRVFAEYVAR